MRRLQTFYAVQMAAHGYGYMKFRYETDAGGEPVVHRMDGDHGDAYYLETPSSHSLPGEEVLREYERASHVYFIVIDNSIDLLPYGIGLTLVQGMAGGHKNRGSAYVTGGFGFNLAAHELTHAFGILWHDSAITPTSCRMADHEGTGCRRVRRGVCRCIHSSMAAFHLNKHVYR